MQTKGLILANHPGKVPPHALDIERAVLGAIMIEAKAIVEVAEILTPETFYKHANQLIYKSCIELYDKHQPIDLLTVTQDLQKKGLIDEVGGVVYITDLTTNVNSAANLLYHAYILKELYVKRQLITLAYKAAELGFDQHKPIHEQMDLIDTEVQQLHKSLNGKALRGLKQAIDNNIKQAEDSKVSKTHLRGLSSGFVELDKITRGWRGGQLIILGARPAMGKSALALQFAIPPAYVYNKNVLFFSLEMSKGELVGRLASIRSGVSTEKIDLGKADDKEYSKYTEAMKALDNGHLDIPDNLEQNIRTLKSSAMMARNEMGSVDLIIVDYLQLMDGPGKDRYEKITEISRGLKMVAKQMDVPVIALAQLSRSLESRQDKRPILSDLRDSGSLEQDADIIMFLYRPEYYGELVDGNNNSLLGIAELNVAKHRGGKLDRVLLRFQHDITRFEEIDRNNQSRSNRVPF